MSTISKDQATLKPTYTRFAWEVLRGAVLILALYANISLLTALLFGGTWYAAALVFICASLTLRAMLPKAEPLPATECESTVKAGMRRLPDWTVVAYLVVTGLFSTWVCVFLWFFRRYSLFSRPVLSATGLVLALYAAVGFLVAHLISGNWRTILIVFMLESWGLSWFVLRVLRWGIFR